MMSQSRFNYLWLINIESKILTKLKFDVLIVNFVEKNVGKKLT